MNLVLNLIGALRSQSLTSKKSLLIVLSRRYFKVWTQSFESSFSILYVKVLLCFEMIRSLIEVLAIEALACLTLFMT